jgi:hypothetical protein
MERLMELRKAFTPMVIIYYSTRIQIRDSRGQGHTGQSLVKGRAW